mgnify:CR=1 FL=1
MQPIPRYSSYSTNTANEQVNEAMCVGFTRPPIGHPRKMTKIWLRNTINYGVMAPFRKQTRLMALVTDWDCFVIYVLTSYDTMTSTLAVGPRFYGHDRKTCLETVNILVTKLYLSKHSTAACLSDKIIYSFFHMYRFLSNKFR